MARSASRRVRASSSTMRRGASPPAVRIAARWAASAARTWAAPRRSRPRSTIVGPCSDPRRCEPGSARPTASPAANAAASPTTTCAFRFIHAPSRRTAPSPPHPPRHLIWQLRDRLRLLRRPGPRAPLAHSRRSRFALHLREQQLELALGAWIGEEDDAGRVRLDEDRGVGVNASLRRLDTRLPAGRQQPTRQVMRSRQDVERRSSRVEDALEPPYCLVEVVAIRRDELRATAVRTRPVPNRPLDPGDPLPHEYDREGVPREATQDDGGEFAGRRAAALEGADVACAGLPKPRPHPDSLGFRDDAFGCRFCESPASRVE